MDQSFIPQIPQYPNQQHPNQYSHPQVQFTEQQNFQIQSKYTEYQAPSQPNQLLNQDNDTQNYQYIATLPGILEPEPMNCIIPATSELGGLYLGGLDAALDVDLLKKHKIRAVLTTSVETPLKYSPDVIHFHESIQAHDKDNYDISQHFEQAIEFIDRHRKYTSVLVHCYAGVSRSASCLISYLMKIYKWPLEKSLWFSRQKRRFVRPNPGFMKKLIEYEKQLFGYSSLSSKRQQLLTQPYPVQPQQIGYPQTEQKRQPQQQYQSQAFNQGLQRGYQQQPQTSQKQQYNQQYGQQQQQQYY